MVQTSLPGWFQADELFTNDGNWYFGSQAGVNIGPYADRDTAENKSNEVVERLRKLKSDDDRLQVVRKILQEEWETVGEGAPAETVVEEIDLAPPPPEPVRGGEEQRRWYRAARFFQVDDVWFFSTREGIDVGPYYSEVDAKKHERHLVSLLIRTRTPEEAYRVIYEYKHRPAPEYATPILVSRRR